MSLCSVERDISVQCWETCHSALKRDLQITSMTHTHLKLFFLSRFHIMICLKHGKQLLKIIKPKAVFCKFQTNQFSPFRKPHDVQFFECFCITGLPKIILTAHFWTLSRSQTFFCVRPLLHTAADCSGLHLICLRRFLSLVNFEAALNINILLFDSFTKKLVFSSHFKSRGSF